MCIRDRAHTRARVPRFAGSLEASTSLRGQRRDSVIKQPPDTCSLWTLRCLYTLPLRLSLFIIIFSFSFLFNYLFLRQIERVDLIFSKTSCYINDSSIFLSFSFSPSLYNIYLILASSVVRCDITFRTSRRYFLIITIIFQMK